MTISTTTNKVSYSGNGSTTTFAYTFKIFADGDLNVFIRTAAGTETLQTLTTDYTVTNAGNNSGGNVVFGTAPAATETVVIQRVLDLTQETDYVANDPFPAESHEEALDRLTMVTQQIQEELDRSIKASVTNTISTTEFAISAADRANKVFAFDGSGDISVTQEIGTFKGNWTTATDFVSRDIVKDSTNNNIYIANTSHTSTGSLPISSNADVAKWDLIVDAASATASASAASSSASAAASSATDAETAQTAAEAAQSAAETAQTAAESAQSSTETLYDNFDDRYLGAKASDPATDNDGGALIAGALYFNTTTGMKVYDGSAWDDVKPSAAEQTNIDTVAGISANVTTVAGISTNVTTVAGISSDVTTVAGIDSNITAVAADATDIGTVATNIANVNTVGGNISSVNAVAAIDSDVTAVAGDAADIGTVAGIAANVTTVAGVSANVTTVAGISADVTTVAGDSADIQLLADNIGTISSKANAGANSDITSLSGLTTALSVAQGGTGADNAADARTNLGVDAAGTAVALSIALG